MLRLSTAIVMSCFSLCMSFLPDPDPSCGGVAPASNGMKPT